MFYLIWKRRERWSSCTLPGFFPTIEKYFSHPVYTCRRPVEWNSVVCILSTYLGGVCSDGGGGPGPGGGVCSDGGGGGGPGGGVCSDGGGGPGGGVCSDGGGGGGPGGGVCSDGGGGGWRCV
ncbi:hypothetical protein J4Q44_G00339020 [Coregonus suidteri]|uniref:Uncharacterized protein n=1 Tax=Coregonus suidteri TaxID=861788 RepID=A0AAN8KVQ4_9TELE